MQALKDAIGRWLLGFGPRAIHVLDRQVELLLVPLGTATELPATIGRDPQERDAILLEEGQHAAVQQVGRRDQGFAVIQTGEGGLL
jgi:hypothetical protein